MVKYIGRVRLVVGVYVKKRNLVIRINLPHFLRRHYFRDLQRYIPQFIKTPLKRFNTWWLRVREKTPFTRTHRARLATLGVLIVFVAAQLIAIFDPFMQDNRYELGASAALLSEISEPMAKKIAYDSRTQAYTFNSSYSATTTDNTGEATQATATLAKDPKKGITVNDPSTETQFGLTPSFNLDAGKQDGNRIVYPLSGTSGWLVYSLHSIGVKEDILLTGSPGKTANFSYNLNLADGTEARLRSDGSVGVYGNSILSGNVTTGSEADAALLEKARESATKDTLLFNIPAPTIVDDQGTSTAEAKFELSGKTLTVKASKLDTARYPLTIDPSIYVVTAQQFMQGNNETNVDFNVADKLIQKGKTTGARFDEWLTDAVNLPSPAWGGGAVATGGYMYQIGGTSFNGQTFTSQGTNTYVVPSGVTSLTLKAWGGGGGSGAGGATAVGGAGGGGGYATSTITVTPGETLTVYVGGAGQGGIHNALGVRGGGGGGGGGYTSIYRGSTPLLIAAGGGGGGGGRNAIAGGAGGAGGGTNGVAGTQGAANNGAGGGAGTQSAGGSGGTGGNNSGAAGNSLTGGAGADGNATTNGSDGSGAAGGGGGGGNGGIANQSITRAAGGGGGGGYFGGGGGGATSSVDTAAGGGGGGGSGYTNSGGTLTAGSGADPGNNTDSGRNGAGQGGVSGPANGDGNKGAGGALLITNGSGGSTVSPTVSWVHLNTDNGTLEGPNPGAGECSGWCSTSAYSLPSSRVNHSVIAYNGYLYVIGGQDAAGTRVNTIYVAKLGANGEPTKWHPTSTDQSTWTYWNATTTLSSTRSLLGAVAYNNRLYIVGGLTGSGTGTSVATLEYTDINPNGTLGSWTTSTALPAGLFGHSIQTYNDRLYVIGGSNSYSATPNSQIRYIKLDSSGAPTDGWQLNGTNFDGARISGGGQMTAILGGYMYLSGGCDTYTTSGYCSSIRSDTQVASINADGSLDTWNAVGSLSSQRTGASLVTWRNNIYHIGGCSSQNTTTGDCNSAMLGTINMGDINQDGDASTVGQSSAPSSGTCNAGTASTDCNLPSTSYIGNMLAATIITNGYLYVIGGCNDVATSDCATTSSNVAYVAISSTGVMSRPAACTGGSYQNNIWCVATSQLAGGIAASSPVVFGGRIYLVGGLTGAGNSDSLDRATINTDGSLTGWTRQTLTGLDNGDTANATDVDSVSYTYAYARANPSASSTIPGNLFIFGGCNTSSSGNGCSGYSSKVFKCSILGDGAIGSGSTDRCTTTSQLQIGTMPGASSAGLGLMSGTVYANYVYLIGGVSNGLVDQRTVKYAKIDDSNNVVAVSGSDWILSGTLLSNGRRRAAAFGYNGYIYVVGGFEATGGGVLKDIEFVKVNVNDGSLVSNNADNLFEESAVVINQRWGLSVTVSNSYAYVIGGCTVGNAPADCTARTDVIQTFQIYNNDSGAPAGYANSATTYGANRIGASAAILNGRLYVAGGCTGTIDCATPTDSVAYAAIDATGALGTWGITTAALPAARAWGKLEVAGGKLYYVGGQDTNGAAQTTVYYATPSSGNVTAWSTASNGIPAARTKFGAAVWNDRLYVIGGSSTAAGMAVFNLAGASTFTVPSGVSTVTVKAWGAGGGGGNGSSSTGKGGAGGGGGYAQADISVTGGESLSISVGTGGTSGTGSSQGGNGGGFSAVLRSTTYLVQAGGGGGGGGSLGTSSGDGGAGGAGGGATAANGTVGEGTSAGGLGYGGSTTLTGTPSDGGTAGTGGAAGASGAANAGGNAGGSVSTTCNSAVTLTGGNGGTGAGGMGGNDTTACANGGGGGGGRFGGGGGGSTSTTNRGGGGGGGGSSLVTGSNQVQTTGSGAIAGNSTDTMRNGAGNGGAGATTTAGTNGAAGSVIISWGSVTNTVYVSPQPASDGNLSSAWTTSTSFDTARYGASAIAYANNLYLFGGNAGSNNLSDVQYASLGYKTGTIEQSGTSVTGTGTAWTSAQIGRTLQYPDGSTAVITAASGTSMTVDVSKTVAAGTLYVVQDGSVGDWYYTTSLPAALSEADVFAANGYIYILGGRSSSGTCDPITLVAPVSANTPISNGNNPTGVGEWFETNQRYTTARYGVAAAYYDGKAYVTGGACGNTLTYATTDRVQQTTLLSQPQIARYSLEIDTDTDVFPTTWLLNGVDNSIGARWQLTYRSMHDLDAAVNPAEDCGTSATMPTMTTWGADTNFGNVALGVLGVYTPKNSSSGNINCARYYYFSISVDSSQAFGYPDDVTRGPTITDLTLQFTADPAKRLMHGRTFTGGLQQPIDTPKYAN